MSIPIARITGWTLLAGLVGVVVFAGVWRLHGGRIERVETPSMGIAAPVGSLLWVAPVNAARLRAGDFIAFHPPGEPDRTYSHRVLRVYADGTLTTKGAISAPDPWRLRGSDVVGRVVMTWKGVGWVLLAAPLLVVGACVVGVVTSRLRPGLRASAAMVGASVVLAIAVCVYRPFTRADEVAFRPDPQGARATYVSTGLLPVRLEAEGGRSVRLADGAMGSVVVPGRAGQRRFEVRLSPAVPWRFWVVLVAVCFVPALSSAAYRRRARPPAEAAQPRQPSRAGWADAAGTD